MSKHKSWEDTKDDQFMFKMVKNHMYFHVMKSAKIANKAIQNMIDLQPR